MKKIILIFLIIISFKINSQTQFLPHVNAEWHYNFKRTFSNNFYNESVKYIRDSVLGLETAKVVLSTKYFRECNDTLRKLTLFKKVNDSVFFRNPITNHQWQMLINYNAIAGQSWTFTIKNIDNTPQTYTVTVNSVNTSLINGILHKDYAVTYKTYNAPFMMLMTYNGTIYERFGDTQFLFDFFQKTAPACDFDRTQGIICYQDSTFGLKQFTAYACDYVSLTRIQKQSEKIDGFIVYPNPVANSITIQIKNSKIPISLIQIFDVSGRLLKEEEINSSMEKIILPVSDLEEGIYFLKLYCDNKLIAVKKLVKE